MFLPGSLDHLSNHSCYPTGDCTFYIVCCKSYTLWGLTIATFEKSFRVSESVLKISILGIARNFCQTVAYTKGCFRYQNKIILFNSPTSSKINKPTKVSFFCQWFICKVNNNSKNKTACSYAAAQNTYRGKPSVNTKLT